MRRCCGVVDFALVAVCLAFLGCARPVPAPGPAAGALDAEVRALLAALDRAQNAADLEGFGALMADDVVLLPPDGRPVAGKPAVLEFYRGLFQAALAIRHEPEESFAEGRMVVHRGRAVGSVRPNGAGAAEIPFDNTYLCVLRRGEDGRLRFSHLMFNSRKAPAPGR